MGGRDSQPDRESKLLLEDLAARRKPSQEGAAVTLAAGSAGLLMCCVSGLRIRVAGRPPGPPGPAGLRFRQRVRFLRPSHQAPWLHRDHQGRPAFTLLTRSSPLRCNSVQC